MADGEGFEPSTPLRVYGISSAAPSTGLGDPSAAPVSLSTLLRTFSWNSWSAKIEQMFDAAMEHFEHGLALLAQQDLSTVAPVQLGLDIKRVRSCIDRAEAECARRVEAFDRGRGHAATPDTSTLSWLRNNCNLSGATADKHVKLARQLPQLDQTQKALESGQIGIEHALEIARATDDLGLAAEDELLKAAQTKDPAELRQTAREIRHRVDAKGSPAGHGAAAQAAAAFVQLARWHDRHRWRPAAGRRSGAPDHLGLADRCAAQRRRPHTAAAPGRRADAALPAPAGLRQPAQPGRAQASPDRGHAGRHRRRPPGGRGADQH